ncbi:MAG: hypothetical protein LBB57_05325 [Clostridiales Family XIII bacterium]|jgi:hypothetical protein|nr:hypothetical protein [Clostridiales Family XIII bacterium]
MQYIFIGVSIALILLIGLVTLAVSWMANEVRGQIRRRTAELITLYDAFEEREAAEAGETGETGEAWDAPPREAGELAAVAQGATSVLRETEQIGAAHYLNAELPVMYREIRNRFYFNPSQLLKTLPIADVPRGEGGPATQLLRRIDYETTFAMSGLSAEDQYRLLSESAGAGEQALISEFGRAPERFDFIDFCDFLRLKASREPQRVILYAPTDMFNYRMFSEDIEVVADADICDGVQIEADSMIWDFAIKGREIS